MKVEIDQEVVDCLEVFQADFTEKSHLGYGFQIGETEVFGKAVFSETKDQCFPMDFKKVRIGWLDMNFRRQALSF